MLTPKLDRSVVIAKDLKDQPNSVYILLVGSGEEGSHLNYYAVDYYEASLSEGLVEFFRQNGDLIFATRADGQWALLRRDACRVVTERELVVFTKKDTDEQVAFMKEIDPEGMKAAEERAKRGFGLPMIFSMGGDEGADGHPHAAQKKTRTPEEEAALEETVRRQYL